MTLQLCLNRARSKAEHPAVPHTPAELAADIVPLFAAGARSFHVHVYQNGQQTLQPDAVDETLNAVRTACPKAELAVSTAEGIAPTAAERVRLIAAWEVWPDTLCVNLSEDGIADVLVLAEARGAWLEAGLFTPGDVQQFKRLAHLRWRRVLLEPQAVAPELAAAQLNALLHALKDHLPDLPRVAHGMDNATWPILRRAAALGLSSRIGSEDVLTLPDGSRPAGNLDLYRAAQTIMEESL